MRAIVRNVAACFGNNARIGFARFGFVGVVRNYEQRAGFVVHAGSWYVSSNVRVHVYLDVDGIERAPNHTWMSQLEKYV